MAKIQKAMSGSMAAAYTAYAFTEVAGIYPITPSTTLSELTDEWASAGKENMFGQVVKVVEMQSEAGAAGTVHGSLQAGSLTTTFTASQGLLLMIPNMYKMAGELLPVVIHVTARALATHALSIFGDHSDVMAARQTGFAMLASANVQESMDLAAVAHLSAIKGRVPFMHFFDGFRTSDEIQKVDLLDYDELRGLVDQEALADFRSRGLNPQDPVLRGAAQNPDIFFQARESANRFYDAVPSIVEEYMAEINKLTGRNYELFKYHGHTEAERVIIAMGSVCDTIEETVNYLVERGEKVGVLKVRLYRPFSAKHFLDKLPKSVKTIGVLDRTKEPGALGEPLFLDVNATLYAQNEIKPTVVGGRYGLGSKDVTPGQILAVFKNLAQDIPKNSFTIGIEDDVTGTSLPTEEEIDITPDDTISAKIWGLGSDGTVGANKNTIKIIADTTDYQTQAYFSYDSKKSGGITNSHLRFGKSRIRAPYLVSISDFVACHKQSYLAKYDVLKGLKPGGTFLLNTTWSVDELEKHLPGKVKQYLAKNNINFYIINASEIAQNIGLGPRTNTVLQSAFFKLIDIIPMEDAIREMKDAIDRTYKKRGQAVLDMNHKAVDEGVDKAIKVEIPASWSDAPIEAKPVVNVPNLPDYYKNFNMPIDRMEGDLLPVSAFMGREDGTFPQGSSKYEKRAIADFVPSWEKENCIQCNLCSLSCPHATIRPFLSTDDEVQLAPENWESLEGTGARKGLNFSIFINQMDCVGCSVCADVCPGKGGKKALVMQPQQEQEYKYPVWDYALNKLSEKKNPLSKDSIPGSQFETPLLEYSGACAGCGETPYAKLVTQLYGDSMIIANATGCSSIWGGSSPSTPYTTNRQGRGPAWANSLFEDAAEFGLGMVLGDQSLKDGLAKKAVELGELVGEGSLKEAIKEYVNTLNNTTSSKEATAVLIQELQNPLLSSPQAEELRKYLLDCKDSLPKMSHWIFGGDGWAYDIGFGGLDHVISTGANINILVMDTEVYSNTGGQQSKSSPIGAISKFAASGKGTAKKDLGMIAMSYGNVYVAQIGLGANPNQAIKALVEAENYPGPSIVIAYSPCIAHGIKGGMGKSQQQIKDAVASGYWHLYRYNPLLKQEDKNPFTLDSKEPSKSIHDFLDTETRYASLKRFFPDKAEGLYAEAEAHSKRKYEEYKRLSEFAF